MSAPFPPPVVPAGWYENQADTTWAWHHDGTSWSGWQLQAGELVFVGEPTLQHPPSTVTLVRRRTSVGEIEVGDVVRHPTFGWGVVIEVTGPDHSREAHVRFPDVGAKHLALNWAKLEKVV